MTLNVSVLRSSLRFVVADFDWRPSCSRSRSWAAPAPGPRPLLRARSWAAPCLVSLLIVFALAVCGHAQSSYPGGPHYDVTYSGGTVTSTGGPYPVGFRSNDDQYNSNNQTYGEGDVAYSPPGSGAGPNVTCSGEITATCTWKPTAANEPPPDSVIVEEDGDAWYGTYPDYSGTCDDGLGDLPVYGSSSGSSSGTRYTVKSNPGASFTLTCSPSSTATTTQDGAYASASVSYKATISPVYVTLQGTTKDTGGSDNILIGQGCVGTLSAGPATLSDFHWDPGGDTFDKFVVAPDLSTGHVVLLFGDTWGKPSPLWHYSKDSDGNTTTVKCSATASINGTVIGTVQGQRDLQVWAPYYAFKNLTGPVTVANIGAMALYAGGPPTILPSGDVTWSPPGMKNGGRVGTPALFMTSLTNSGTGRWQFVQLATIGRWEYQTTSGNTAVYPDEHNGVCGLDNFYPYPGSAGTYAPPFPADSDQSPGLTASPTYWMADSPLHQLLDMFTRVRVDESFDDYMMYVPPDDGLGSEWVPLHLFKWKWQADITQAGSGWAAGWTSTPPMSVSALSSTRCTTHPLWQSLLLNNN